MNHVGTVLFLGVIKFGVNYYFVLSVSLLVVPLAVQRVGFSIIR